jgi:hypothetical protein
MSGIFVGNALAGNGDVAPPGFTVELSCKICSCIVNRDMQ